MLASSASAFDSAFRTAGAVTAGTWVGFTVANLGTSNNVRATNGTVNAFGIAQTFNFGLPTGAAIRGIAVQIEGSHSVAGAVNYSVDLSWNGGGTYTTAKASSFTGTIDALQLAGGDADTWGRTWAATEFATANFRFRVYKTAGAGNLQIDRVRINVTYDPPGYVPPPANLRTGSYVGTGVNGRGITGLGFRPDLVIVTSDDTCVALPYLVNPCGHTTVMRTSTMLGNVSKAAYFYAYPPLVDRIQSLDADGFSVGEPPDHNSIANGGTADNDDPTTPYHCANHAGVLYYWAAFKDLPGEIDVGSYDGNNTDDHSITGIGFQPDLVLVLPEDGERAVYRTSTMAGDVSYTFDGDSPSIDAIQLLQADGFQVGFGDPSPDAKWDLNFTGVKYHYVAWKEVAGRMDVGSYTGTGVDPLNVAGVGFQPEYLIVKRSAPVGGPGSDTPVIKSAGMGNAVDRTAWALCYNNCDPTDLVQALQTTGFQVGGNTGVNAAAAPNTHYWMAFGGQQATVYYRSIGTNATPYATGQVTVTNGSTAVAGGGVTPPDWVTANRGRGDQITITGQGTYTVLGVSAATSLSLTAPFAGTSGTYTYSIVRHSTSLQAWYECVDGTTACTGGGANLVTSQRKEVGIAYRDGTLVHAGLTLDTATTSAAYDITLTADAGNRHLGLFGAATGVVIDGVGNSIRPYNSFMTFEWLEFRNGSPRVFHISNIGSPNKLTVRYCLFHSSATKPLVWFSGAHDADVYDNVFWGSDPALDIDFVSAVNVYNNTFYNMVSNAVTKTAAPTVNLRNNIALACGGSCYSGTFAASSNNISSDATGSAGLISLTATTDPVTCTDPGGQGCVTFQGLGATPNLHLKAATGYTNKAVDAATNLSALIPPLDIDRQGRLGPPAVWDIGADELNGFTAVRLASFAAGGHDSGVLLEWQTASELNNLGFHVYRGRSADGPWTRLNPSLIPGLGSSPDGKRYTWTDTGLANGVTYFYRLEDVDRSGVVTSHGPVSGTPESGLSPPAGSGLESAQPGGRVDSSGSAETPSETAPSANWTPHGNPGDVSLRVLRRTASSLTLELTTGGFYALAQADGSARLHVPGFFDLAEPGLPQIPTRRAWLDVPAGSQVRVASAVPTDLVVFPALGVARAGAPQAIVEKGTYQASFRRVQPQTLRRSLFPDSLARVLETAFQGETKKAYVELAPLRVDAASGRVVLARKLVVRLVFQGRARGERSRGGSRGRLEPGAAAQRAAPAGRMLARFATRSPGLHAVAFEEVMNAGGARVLSSSWLRLSRLGQPVAFHVEPRPDRFGPGSTLFFLAEDPRAAYTNETVYELAIASGGVQMPVDRASRNASAASVPALLATRSFETNTNYLPALLNARDLWLWDFGLLAPNGRDYPFSVSSPSLSAGPASLALDLQGGSDSTKVDPDHQVLVSLNGVPLGEARWDGLTALHLETSFDSSILRDGPNALRLDNLDTTGGFDSVVYLDRFSVDYPHALVAEMGRLEGRASSSGLVQAAGFSPGSLLLDVSTATPRWLIPVLSGSQLLFTAEAQRRYLAVSPQALLRPEVRPAAAAAAALRDGLLQADWLVIAPEELLPAAEPLLAHRESQGLSARAVSLEQIRDEFGFGERSPQAMRDFLAYAYHHWAAPSPRYVLLLGDASSDPKGFLPTATRKDLLPSPLVKSTFLWTASDPSLAAVNGDDLIPDLAIGRITAGSLAEAEAAVQKILAFETSGQTLAGNAVLVADNPDLAGNFEANANDIASLLPNRRVDRIFLSQLGTGTRAAVLNAFDAGAALFSYVGHGSQGLWASEGIFRALDVGLLKPQARQPLLLTMTCSNGYFISPWSNALSERLVLAADKGAIAAFSPSGLSLDDAAHLFHRALVHELEHGGHERIGDLVLAAQKDYADSGAFPELLSIYHLFADPALRIHPES